MDGGGEKEDALDGGCGVGRGEGGGHLCLRDWDAAFIVEGMDVW